MDIFNLILLAEEEEKNVFDGMFSGARGVMGVVLAITGVLIIYIAIKVAKGYSFVPTFGGETIIEEDKHVDGKAKAVRRQTTTLPDFGGGGEREFVEWEIMYTVDGKEYTQVIPDDGYSEGDELDIRYDPRKPENFYLAGEDNEDTDDDGSATEENNRKKSRNTGLILGILGVLVIIGGVALLL
ncbi:DUF3592 domain-containing protein [uncultured Ruminococcus sp.]|uniref:DUF3592 domain-containing protein n=1 Tax=uncultured Ruminococcus sp. TaxID=165186 RepID=UPI0025F10BE9|nr:DUF3592 domain-containing protein [uncultured Ruminococcus sp.]